MSVSILSLADARVVSLHIRVEESDWHDEQGNLLYTHLIVERSVLSKDGPFEELTATYWKTASIPSDPGAATIGPGPLVNINGATLELRVDGTMEVDVAFVGVDPLTYSDAALQIAFALGNLGRSYVDVANTLVIETVRMGTGARLEVLSGDAAPLLGLNIGEAAFGKDPHIHLVPGRSEYAFRDLFGNSSYWYRVRLFNRFNLAVSEPLALLQAGDIRTVPPEQLSMAYLYLLNPDGRPLFNSAVTIQPLDSGSKNGAVVSSQQLEARTDKTGYVSFWLLRGYKMRVSVPALGMNREFVVPDVDSFSLLDPALGEDDLFAPRHFEIVFANRQDNKRTR